MLPPMAMKPLAPLVTLTLPAVRAPVVVMLPVLVSVKLPVLEADDAAKVRAFDVLAIFTVCAAFTARLLVVTLNAAVVPTLPVVAVNVMLLEVNKAEANFVMLP